MQVSAPISFGFRDFAIPVASVPYLLECRTPKRDIGQRGVDSFPVTRTCHLSPPRDPCSGMYHLSSTWLLHLGCATCPPEPSAFGTQENNELSSPSLFKPRIPIHTKPTRSFTYRDFAYRDFTTCEDEGSYPWVSRVPKRRNQFTLHRFGISHTGISRHNLRRRGFIPLGFPGAEMPKSIHTTPLRDFTYRDTGILRLAKTRGLALGFPGCRNADRQPRVLYKWMVQVTPMDLGIYGPDSFATCEG
jgi:hypothetical protein